MSPTKIRRAFGLYLKVVRLSTFCAVVGGVAILLLARSVFGSATRSIDELNREWSRRAGALDQSSYRVRLNGQAITTSSRMTDESVHDVLEAADAQCRAKAGGLEKDIAKLPGVAMARLTSFVFGVVRREAAGRGFVACVEREGDRGLGGLATDLREVVRTGDLARLGTFRYVSAERDAGATKTHVLRQWAEGELNLPKMFPGQGDTPGTDLPEVARPEGSRRVLDASVEGSSFGVRVYDAPGAPGAVLARYDRELVAKGWTNVALDAKDASTTRVFDQAGADVFITATTSGDRSVVSIASMPAR